MNISVDAIDILGIWVNAKKVEIYTEYSAWFHLLHDIKLKFPNSHGNIQTSTVFKTYFFLKCRNWKKNLPAFVPIYRSVKRNNFRENQSFVW